jgi:hypothetical protein
MAKTTKGNRRLTEELLESAQEMCASGLVSEATYEKISVRLHAPHMENHSTVKNGERSGSALPARRKST